MNKVAKKLKEGDIFYVPIKGKYIFAKIVLDMRNKIFKKEPNHRLFFYSGCYLIEVYKGIYDEPKLTSTEIIFPSSFTFISTFYARNEYKIDWTFYEHQPIDYTKIEFPEVLETGDNGYLNFRKFDVSIPTKTLFEDFPKNSNRNQKYTGVAFPSFYQMVDEALHLQKRDDLMTDTEITYFESDRDLRMCFNDRKRIYAQIGESINISYYELALKYGYDLGRFY
jgi:hypothetical protein